MRCNTAAIRRATNPGIVESHATILAGHSTRGERHDTRSTGAAVLGLEANTAPACPEATTLDVWYPFTG